MSYPITQSNLKRAAERVNNQIGQFYNRAPGWVTRAATDFTVDWLLIDLLPYLNSVNGALSILRDPATLSQAQQDEFVIYATEGMENPPADYWLEYNAVRDATITLGARARTVANAVQATGYSVAANGTVAWNTIAGGDQQLSDAAQALFDTMA